MRFLPVEEDGHPPTAVEQKEDAEREARNEGMFAQTGELTTVKDYDHSAQELKRSKSADLTSALR